MRTVSLLIIILYALSATAQPHLDIHNIRLPSDVEYYDNQYSSLYIADEKLYLMSESRLEDNAAAFLTSVVVNDLQKAVNDSTFQPAFTKIPIFGLDVIRKKMQAENQSYEGLEAVVIKNNSVYLSIETATPSDDCYLVKGRLAGNKIDMDTARLLHLAKPKDAAGQHIYNAGFESLEMLDNKLYAFFEYNYFPENNYALCIDTSIDKDNLTKIPISRLPFRITDVTKTPGTNMLTGINFFYNGEGKDEIYRVPPSDTANYPLTNDGKGFRSYCRLVKISFTGNKFICKPYITLPESLWQYNWEGLAKYKNGFFIMNDKYTPKRPYKSVLSYLEIKD